MSVGNGVRRVVRGKGAVVLSPAVAACPDLLTVGPRTVVREGAALLCYRAEQVIESGQY